MCATVNRRTRGKARAVDHDDEQKLVVQPDREHGMVVQDQPINLVTALRVSLFEQTIVLIRQYVQQRSTRYTGFEAERVRGYFVTLGTGLRAWECSATLRNHIVEVLTKDICAQLELPHITRRHHAHLVQDVDTVMRIAVYLSKGNTSYRKLFLPETAALARAYLQNRARCTAPFWITRKLYQKRREQYREHEQPMARVRKLQFPQMLHICRSCGRHFRTLKSMLQQIHHAVTAPIAAKILSYALPAQYTDLPVDVYRSCCTKQRKAKSDDKPTHTIYICEPCANLCRRWGVARVIVADRLVYCIAPSDAIMPLSLGEIL